tara:strand:+ start:1487 stop:1678 length:192 start_codon:yes stop_codon:yes gene_type:complete
VEDLSISEIKSLAKSAGINIPEHLLEEVGYSLNGLLEALDTIPNYQWQHIEALPIFIENHLQD